VTETELDDLVIDRDEEEDFVCDTLELDFVTLRELEEEDLV